MNLVFHRRGNCLLSLIGNGLFTVLIRQTIAEDVDEAAETTGEPAF